MAAKPLPDQALLLKLLRYEPETGKLFWRERTPDMFRGKHAASSCRTFNGRFAGKLAGYSLDSYGYMQCVLLMEMHLTHRLIWKMVTGENPVEIDHINGDRTDNRFANLRSCSHAENSRNKGIESRNATGVAGVAQRDGTGMWRARIKVNGRDINLGQFSKREEAVHARKAAERRYGFHPNHGRKAIK